MERKWVWSGKPWQAFKTFAIIFSFIMNFVLLLVLLIAAPLILPIVDSVAEPLVGGLSDSFVDMSTATISQTIPLNTEMDIAFTLPLSETTHVTTTQAVELRQVPAQFIITGGGNGFISGNVTLALPAGTELPVALNLPVDVDQTIPVVMDVPVQIPLQETDLGEPFNVLRGLFEPLDRLIKGLPSSNDELFGRVTESSPPTEQDTAVR